MNSEDIRNYNVGASDYSKHSIQPWDIWEEYDLNPWDADIVKRVLRNKSTDSRIMDYEKIIHICEKRIDMLQQQEQRKPVDTSLGYAAERYRQIEINKRAKELIMLTQEDLVQTKSNRCQKETRIALF